MGVVQVNTSGFPPIENREETLSFFSGLDFFGCGAFTYEETVFVLFVFFFVSINLYILILLRDRNILDTFTFYVIVTEKTSRYGKKGC